MHILPPPSVSLFPAPPPHSPALLSTYRHIADCSHWVQQDAPEEVNKFMREFLKE